MFDLTITDENRVDVGMIDVYHVEFSFGADENDFELTLPVDSEIELAAGCLLYVEGTDQGGMVTKCRVDTEAGTVTYAGMTWHGILDAHVIRPPEGATHLEVGGDANDALADIISSLGLSDLFAASGESSGFEVSGSFRYVKAYTAIASMLASHGLKLRIAWDGAHAVLSAEEAVVRDADSDQVDFTVERDYLPCNHLVCIGKGEMEDRAVVDVYADADGNISQTQTFFGVMENADVYELSSSEEGELLVEGMDELKERQTAASVEISSEIAADYDIGDVVVVSENITGVTATAPVNKKIVSADSGDVSVSAEIGDASISSIGSKVINL